MLINLLEMIIVGVSQCLLKFLIFQDRIVKTCQFWQKHKGLKLAFNILRKFHVFKVYIVLYAKNKQNISLQKISPVYKLKKLAYNVWLTI